MNECVLCVCDLSIKQIRFCNLNTHLEMFVCLCSFVWIFSLALTKRKSQAARLSCVLSLVLNRQA